MNELGAAYLLATGLAGGLLVYALINFKKSWSPAYIAGLLMTIGWYLVEPVYGSDEFLNHDQKNVQAAFVCVSVFLLTYGIAARFLVSAVRPNISSIIALTTPKISHIFLVIVLLWIALLSWGVSRMNWDLVGSLFPLTGRAGAHMWSRHAGAAAGFSGFLVSSAGYLYLLCLASFGMFFVIANTAAIRVSAIILIAISWPWAFLQGSRNISLAVAMPMLLAYLMHSRAGWAKKATIIVSSGLVFDTFFKIIILYRNDGYSIIDFEALANTRHLGLNMASELLYCLEFTRNGLVPLKYGQGYLAELLNMVPRVLWPDKPMINVDYSIARGFIGGNADIGVFATVASGIIGQGVLNFGWLFGPMFAALLLSIWVAFLTRLRLQGTFLRNSLFLLGMGLTFNLGRDFTLLVLWPMVFGYVLVRIVEHVVKRKRRHLHGDNVLDTRVRSRDKPVPSA